MEHASKTESPRKAAGNASREKLKLSQDPLYLSSKAVGTHETLAQLVLMALRLPCTVTRVVLVVLLGVVLRLTKCCKMSNKGEITKESTRRGRDSHMFSTCG